LLLANGGRKVRYKAVLIDDEPWSLVHMSNIFKWSEMGFEIVSQISNAEEALDIISQTKPDVIFTDIRMPGISGLDLMKSVRVNGVDTEFIIISGFADFSYAQEAIQLGAFEYCLKPISSQQADNILLRLSKRLWSKRHGTTYYEYYEDPNNKQFVSSKEENMSEEIIEDKFDKILSYINDNFQTKIHLKELANTFFLHPNYICSLFKKKTGLTFSEYITKLRMEEASRILADKSRLIDEVAVKCGYDDYFYFNKVFKKYYGITPTEYRKKIY